MADDLVVPALAAAAELVHATTQRTTILRCAPDTVRDAGPLIPRQPDDAAAVRAVLHEMIREQQHELLATEDPLFEEQRYLALMLLTRLRKALRAQGVDV